MRRHRLPKAAAVVAGLAAAGQAGPWAGTVLGAETATVIDLAAPAAAAQGGAVELRVTAGPLPRGARLVLTTEAGEVLGAVAPFPPGGRSGSRATVPVPHAALTGGRLRLRLQVAGPGTPPRPPDPGEVERLELVATPPQGK
jgi:hypothetical protein